MSLNIAMKRSKSSPSRGWNKHKFCIFAWTNNYSTTWWIVLALLWWQTQSWLLTCHRSLDVQQVLLGTQDCGALSYEPQSHRLLHAALLGEVSFQHVHFGLPLAVKHLFSCQPVTGGEWDSCGDEKNKTSYLQCFNIPFIEKWGVNSTSLSKRHSSCLISKYFVPSRGSTPCRRGSWCSLPCFQPTLWDNLPDCCYELWVIQFSIFIPDPHSFWFAWQISEQMRSQSETQDWD